MRVFQIRIHDAVDCDFYLHVMSQPIIEHCRNIRFAPYNLQYNELHAQMLVTIVPMLCWRFALVVALSIQPCS